VSLQADALVVHLFVAANGPRPDADREYLRTVWARCAAGFGMTESITGLAPDPDLDAGTGLLAGRKRPEPGGPYVQEMLVRREHDTFCLTVMREPPGETWSRLDQEWSDTLDGLTATPGVIGSAQLYLARLVDPGAPDPAALGAAVRARLPDQPEAGQWWRSGITVRDFAVWEASAPADGRDLRRIVVVAATDQDPELSAWTWVVGARELPRFGRYLLHGAKLRYQRRVWAAEEAWLRQARKDADAAVSRLLKVVLPGPGAGEPSEDELAEASRQIVALQADEVGLVRTMTSLREMRRTVEIATANLTALSGSSSLNGLFADDRELGGWFGQQLADDETYLEAARERAGQVATLTDQLVQRGLQRRQDRLARRQEGLQRRQERFNLGLTGVVGAILMVLAAIQSLEYTVPLPHLVEPGVVATLGAVALLASLVVLRVAVPDHRWSLWLVWAGVGTTTAASTWVAVSATGPAATAVTTRLWSGAGFAVGVAVAALVSGRRTRRYGPPPRSPGTGRW